MGLGLGLEALRPHRVSTRTSRCGTHHARCSRGRTRGHARCSRPRPSTPACNSTRPHPRPRPRPRPRQQRQRRRRAGCALRAGSPLAVRRGRGRCSRWGSSSRWRSWVRTSPARTGTRPARSSARCLVRVRVRVGVRAGVRVGVGVGVSAAAVAVTLIRARDAAVVTAVASFARAPLLAAQPVP